MEKPNVFRGEKYLEPSGYNGGPDPSDAGSCMQGHDYGVIRFCSPDLLPMADTPGVDVGSCASAAHAHRVAFCLLRWRGTLYFIPDRSHGVHEHGQSHQPGPRQRALLTNVRASADSRHLFAGKQIQNAAAPSGPRGWTMQACRAVTRPMIAGRAPSG